MATQMDKWMAYFSPLFGGRFDVFTSAEGPSREAWHQGLAMTRGRFWVRACGGHDLRRVAGPMTGRPPSLADPLVGRSDGRTATVTTFPWVGHAAGEEFVYGLTVVGAGGVADATEAPTVRAAFDEAGALVGPAPNVVENLAVDSLSGGRFLLRWTYDEEGEEAKPAAFRIYNDAGNPGTVDYATVVATAEYQPRWGNFAWTSTGFSEGQRVRWSVQAVSATGMESPAATPTLAVARAALPAAPSGVSVRGVR